MTNVLDVLVTKEFEFLGGLADELDGVFSVIAYDNWDEKYLQERRRYFRRKFGEKIEKLRGRYVGTAAGLIINAYDNLFSDLNEEEAANTLHEYLLLPEPDPEVLMLDREWLDAVYDEFIRETYEPCVVD